MNILLLAIYIICGAYMLLNFKYDLQMLQQNSYRVERYYRWLKQSSDVGSAWRLVDVALLFLLNSTLLKTELCAIMIALVLLTKFFLILRRKYKKPLVFTRRVWRIYSVCGVLSVAGFVVACVFCTPKMALSILLLISILSWVVVMLAVLILTPVERMINRRYYNEARRILKSIPNLTVVGITGSFGKTSTKHYLYRILSESYDVLMTPGSFNTPMGVIRTVREQMKPYNDIFICEMGAKQLGDIKEICDLVDPKIGIVTAVGEMHLETFKSIENVQRTKFELVDALPADGLAVVNNDFEYCANRPVDNVTCARYAVSNPKGADYIATDIQYTPSGTRFAIEGSDNFRIDLETELVGECNISNLVAAVIVALRLNVPEERIKYAVKRIEQVEHRLNLKRTAGGVTIIDDAFNSNPTGSRMAVDVLSHFTGGKRIIVTPGMIELGDRQFDLNKALGQYIGEKVDIAIIVGNYNREALSAGVRSTDFNKNNLYEVPSFEAAQQLLATLLESGDTVLYENDLPDTFK